MQTQLPSHAYLNRVAEGKLESDNNQLSVLKLLDITHQQLVKRKHQRESTTGQLRRKIKPRSPIQGLYLWGSVGTGKTQIMDLFYEHIPVRKMRCHFHSFMRDLHHQLTEKQGIKDPLQAIAKKMADDHLLICFDEFFVSNITDAMLLGELFKSLFSGGICLVTTSNIAPKDLYKDGIQRERFLPTISLLNRFTRICHLDSHQDYRLKHIKRAGVYHTPLNEGTEHHLEISFAHFSKKSTVSTDPISLYDRPINVVKKAERVIWFTFTEICSPPRSQNDYLSITEHFDTIIVSKVPQISSTQTNTAILFIKLVDVLYDAHTRLIVSAATPIEAIYPSGKMSFEFKRTTSRLIEMNTANYFMS